jgi:protein TonB
MACPTETGPPSKTPHKWVAVSAGVMARNRVGGKDPKYPSDAKQAHINGRVVLEATISNSGKVEDLCVSQGPAMLQQVSVDAVKTWRYKPFELNGQAAEVKTLINVDFTLR